MPLKACSPPLSQAWTVKVNSECLLLIVLSLVDHLAANPEIPIAHAALDLLLLSELR